MLQTPLLVQSRCPRMILKRSPAPNGPATHSTPASSMVSFFCAARDLDEVPFITRSQFHAIKPVVGESPLVSGQAHNSPRPCKRPPTPAVTWMRRFRLRWKLQSSENDSLAKVISYQRRGRKPHGDGLPVHDTTKSDPAITVTSNDASVSPGTTYWWSPANDRCPYLVRLRGAWFPRLMSASRNVSRTPDRQMSGRHRRSGARILNTGWGK